MRTLCFIIILIPIISTSCSNRLDKESRLLSELLNREIAIPESLMCHIGSSTMLYDMKYADYKIVTYIDSNGCTPCHMKLKKWDSLINEFMKTDNNDIAFLMIINSQEFGEIDSIIREEEFNYPVMYDNDGIFFKKNKLPAEHSYHTFLLDINNRIIAVGNPAANPKIKDLYHGIIFDGSEKDTPIFCNKPGEALGVLKMNDTIRKYLTLHNSTKRELSIQEIVPSCDCIQASISSKIIPIDSISLVTISLFIDSISGPFRRHVDIYYNEYDNPERITFNGFVMDQSNI